MTKKHNKKTGQSAIEFAALIMFILAAFIVFQRYIVRGVVGRWKTVGDTFGEGRIYSPTKSVECATNVFFPGQPSVWYDRVCFENNCKDDCLEVSKDKGNCESCISSCQTAECSD